MISHGISTEKSGANEIYSGRTSLFLIICVHDEVDAAINYRYDLNMFERHREFFLFALCRCRDRSMMKLSNQVLRGHVR